MFLYLGTTHSQADKPSWSHLKSLSFYQEKIGYNFGGKGIGEVSKQNNSNDKSWGFPSTNNYFDFKVSKCLSISKQLST